MGSYPVAACRGKTRIYGGEPWFLAGGVPQANCLAGYTPKGAVDYASSKINLNNPGTFDAIDFVASTFNTNIGWTFDGINQGLDTGIDVGLSTNHSMVVACNVFAIANSYVSGVQNTTTFGIRPNVAGISTFEYIGLLIGAATAGNVVLSICGRNAYIDGVFIGNIGLGGGTLAGVTIAMGCLNTGGGPSNYWNGDIKGAAYYDIDVSAFIGDITTAAQAL